MHIYEFLRFNMSITKETKLPLFGFLVLWTKEFSDIFRRKLKDNYVRVWVTNNRTGKMEISSAVRRKKTERRKSKSLSLRKQESSTWMSTRATQCLHGRRGGAHGEQKTQLTVWEACREIRETEEKVRATLSSIGKAHRLHKVKEFLGGAAWGGDSFWGR